MHLRKFVCVLIALLSIHLYINSVDLFGNFLVRYLKRKSISLCSYYLTFHWLKDRFPSLFALEILNRTRTKEQRGSHQGIGIVFF